MDNPAINGDALKLTLATMTRAVCALEDLEGRESASEFRGQLLERLSVLQEAFTDACRAIHIPPNTEAARSRDELRRLLEDGLKAARDA